MANTPQAKKRIRRNERRAEINGNRLSRIRTFVKKVEEALASGKAPVTLCPPGGPALAQALAAKLGVAVDAAAGPPALAHINEAICIGCAHCGPRCPTDAIIGAPKQIHSVIQDACIGCGLCVEVCPTECLELRPAPLTLKTWHWPKPALSFGA